MIDQLNSILSKISAFNLNVLFLLGLALFGGAIGGRLFQKIRIPQVVGYIAIGILIGESGLKIVGHEIIETLEPFNYFALGLIGFMIGGELKKEVLAKYGKQFAVILLSEGLTAFLAVSCSIGIAGTFLFGNWKLSWALGLLLGAISSATAPAATSEVLREYKTRGPLTRTVLGIVALDDGLALLLFAVAASLSGVLTGNGYGGVSRLFFHPLYEIGGSIIIGLISGAVLSKLLKKYSEEERSLAFSIGIVLFTCGLSLAVKVDMLLSIMTVGAVVSNFTPRKSKDVFKLVGEFTPPIYVLFFVLVGAKLNLSYMTPSIILLACIYILARSLGKALGANFGAYFAGAPKSVRKYLPLCLFSQAGVAIGLSILASHYFQGQLGNAVIIIITATAFILEIIGPTMVKIGVTKAGEVGLNITEDDLIHKVKVEEVMDKNPPLIYKNTPFGEILNIFSRSTNLFYPVVDNNKRLTGIITVDGIKNIFMETTLSGFLLAADVMEPVIVSAPPESSLSSVKELLHRHNVEYLPIVTKDTVIAGFIERRVLDKIISTKIIELQSKADFLEDDS
ncbi:MAG: cation:proton antiporter [Candidatus Omnitrophota bacterium]